jgi:hypothetical protein
MEKIINLKNIHIIIKKDFFVFIVIIFFLLPDLSLIFNVLINTGIMPEIKCASFSGDRVFTDLPLNLIDHITFQVLPTKPSNLYVTALIRYQ